jgi:CBS domain-containing protein
MNPRSCIVRDYMTSHPVTFKPEMDVLDAVHELVKHRIAGAPVVNDHGEVIGMLSEFDCMKVALDSGYYGDAGGPVSEYMSSTVESVDADMSIVDLAEKFLNTKFRRFPVMTENRLIGQISRRDVLRALETISQS